MNRQRTSVVWKPSREEFAVIVKNSLTLTAIAKALGAYPQAGTFPIIKKRLKEEGIDFSHIKLGIGNAKGRKFSRESVPLEEVMVEHSTYSQSFLKERLLKEGLLENKCAICGLEPWWNGKPLVLRFDHANGISDDARSENLRLICHNCDSQLKTYCGRNSKHRTVAKRCPDCGKEISASSIRCIDCYNKRKIGKVRTKINWPPTAEIQRMLKSQSRNAVAKSLGVSWHALRKRLELH
jgi:hypothetical protein